MERFLFVVLGLLLSLNTALATERVTFNFQKIAIPEALQLLADYKKQNLVVSPEVSGNITMKLENVTWSNAFDYVKRVAGLESFSDENIILITKKDSSLNTLEYLKPEKPPQYPAEIVMLSNVLPSQVASLFHLYPSEYLLPSDDMSYLVAHLPPVRVRELKSLVAALDVHRPQILIEAKIVEVNRDFVQSLGVNWGDSSLSSGGWTASGASTLGAIAASHIGLGFVSSRAVLNARLSAMESEGQGSVVSSPKVFVFDRKPARISKGFEIPYQELQGDGVVTTSFKEASLALDVLPIVSGRDILLDVKLSKDEPDFARSVDGQPPINTSSFSSSVRLMSGQTVAIGGVLSETVSDMQRRVPGLSRVPFLRKIFKSKELKNMDSELFLFITATLAE